MARTGRLEAGSDPAPAKANPLLRLLGRGVLPEVLWGLGLLAILAFVSVAISALLSSIGRV